MSRFKLTIPIWVLSCLIFGSYAHAQAYCALRDPVHAIQEFYPEHASYRSIVRDIAEGHRGEIGKQLPFNIHESELGKHTLYAVMGPTKQLLGYVHVRSERGRWGLSELAWSLDKDLKITGLRLQRSRDGSRSYLESQAFQKQIRGRGFSELKIMLASSGQALAPGKIEVPDTAVDGVIMALRSALKTIVVTRTVWSRALSRLAKTRNDA